MYLLIIFTLLLTLKLSNVVDWSAWIIASPLILMVLLWILNFIMYLQRLATEGNTIKSKRLIDHNLKDRRK